MAPVKFCARCPTTGVCEHCGGPIDETVAILAKHPQCACGSPMCAIGPADKLLDGKPPYPCHRFAIGCASTYSVTWRDLFHLPRKGPHDFLYIREPSEVDRALAYGDLVRTVGEASEYIGAQRR